jgi:hypothetical protein
MHNTIKYTDELKQKSTVKVGQFYRNDSINELFIVAEVQPPGMYVLISLTDGVSWTGRCETIDEIFDASRSKFTLVPDPFTVTPDTN